MVESRGNSLFRRRYAYCVKALNGEKDTKDKCQTLTKEHCTVSISPGYHTSAQRDFKQSSLLYPIEKKKEDPIALCRLYPVLDVEELLPGHPVKMSHSSQPNNTALTDCSTADDSSRSLSCADLKEVSSSHKELGPRSTPSTLNTASPSNAFRGPKQHRREDRHSTQDSLDLNPPTSFNKKLSSSLYHPRQKTDPTHSGVGSRFQTNHGTSVVSNASRLNSRHGISSSKNNKYHVTFNTSTSLNPSDPVELMQIDDTKKNYLPLILEWKNRNLDDLAQQLQDQKLFYQKHKEHLIMKHSNQIDHLQRLIRYEKEQCNKAQVVASIRQQQYQEILKTLAVYESFISFYKAAFPNSPYLVNFQSKAAAQLEHAEAENFRMRSLIEELRFEKEEIQQVVIQKEKELLFLKKIHPLLQNAFTSESGDDVISMKEEHKENKNATRHHPRHGDLKGQVRLCKQENNQLQKALEDLAKRFDLKNAEIETLLETLTERNRYVAELETELWRKRLEEEKKIQEDALKKNEENEKFLYIKDELKIATEQLTRLRAELAHRDSVILTLKSEVIRQSTYNENAEAHLLNLAKSLPRHPTKMHKHEEEKLNEAPSKKFSKPFLFNKSIDKWFDSPYEGIKSDDGKEPWYQRTVSRLDPKSNQRISTVMRPTQSFLNKKVVST